MQFSIINNLLTFMQFLLRSLKKNFLLAVFISTIPFISQAVTLRQHRTIHWNQQNNVVKNDQTFLNYVSFLGAADSKINNYLPYFNDVIRLNNKAQNIKVSIENIKYTTTNNNTPIQNQSLVNNITNHDLKMQVGLENGLSIVWISLLPINANNSNVLLYQSFDVVITYDLTPQTTAFGKKTFVTNSVLASGTWFKIGVTQTGFHKLDAAYLKANGIDLTGVDPRTIKIYGNGPGIIPQRNDQPRIDDLKENPIFVIGEQDGSFNDNDYILMYGKSQFDVWRPKGNTSLTKENNIYSDTTYYYLTFNQGVGKRIIKQNTQPTPAFNKSTYTFCAHHEKDLVNIGKSGRVFLGEAFDRTPTQSFNVTINGFIPGEPVYFASVVAARSYITSSTFNVGINGSNVLTHNINRVGTSYESPYLLNDSNSVTFTPSSANLNITYTYSLPAGGATGWLDYFEVTSKANLVWFGNQPTYRFIEANDIGLTQYTIAGTTASTRIFNVSNPTDVSELLVSGSGNQINVVTQADFYTELIGLSSNSIFLQPTSIQKIKNQNLHALSQVDALYITPALFYNDAVRLANFHKQRGIKIHVIQVNDIYNEFSSGSQDISAIRDFIRMFYTRSTSSADNIKYVTLFGRASYDYKYRTSNNSNFVPTFQSPASNSPLNSYCSDDYFGFLDSNEGKWGSINDWKEALDVGIGRLPISNEQEAASAVNKIIGYHDASKMGNWRNKIVFVSDDEDNNIHQSDANIMADTVQKKFKNYNVDKIWIDAYKEEVIAGGQRYPEAQKAISDAVQKGTFIINYTGHGGELGWASERILTIEDINAWTNADKLALFVTATCEFSRFDDPARVSAGELTFLNANGGSIGLFTTVRLVSAYSNTVLNTIFYRKVGLDSTSKTNPITLGEIMRLTKNDYGVNDNNERNFTLLGDAVMTLAYPKLNVVTTSINSKPITEVTDTLKALSKVTISGMVTNTNNQIANNYNGEVFVTVYDKPSTYITLANNPGSTPMPFSLQKNIIYSGSASVNQGAFSFSFIVPKDISYQFGKGKISYYAKNNTQDANGFNEQFLVGGTADSSANDVMGPEIKLFMDDEKFVFGGLTNQSPLFIAKLYDANGINTIGKGIGRELALTIDNETSKALVLNDYYLAKKDSYTEGEVRYQLKDLAPGKHTATFKAWDTYNNSNETILEFMVANNEDMALQYVLNYPNPFTTNTTFHFDHNKVGEDLTIMIQIYTIGGKLAKTLSTQITAASSHFSDLKWDGLDDYGDKLAKGVYIYRVKVKSSNGKTAEATQKLVILN
jgi:hypothetical protein